MTTLSVVSPFTEQLVAMREAIVKQNSQFLSIFFDIDVQTGNLLVPVPTATGHYYTFEVAATGQVQWHDQPQGMEITSMVLGRMIYLYHTLFETDGIYVPDDNVPLQLAEYYASLKQAPISSPPMLVDRLDQGDGSNIILFLRRDFSYPPLVSPFALTCEGEVFIYNEKVSFSQVMQVYGACMCALHRVSPVANACWQ